MVLVVIITSFMTLLSVLLINQVRSESNRGARATWSQASFQAAEAGARRLRLQARRRPRLLPPLRAPGGVDAFAVGGRQRAAFIRLLGPRLRRQDESRRRLGVLPDVDVPDRQGPLVPADERLLLQPPDLSAGHAEPTTSVRIVGTGRRSMSSTEDMRALESYVRPSNLADFYRFSDATSRSTPRPSGRSTRTATSSTRGRRTPTFRRGLRHRATQHGGRRQIYQNGNFAGKIKNHPIDFSKFLVSLTDIKRAAQVGGVYLNQAGATCWTIDFSSAAAPSPRRPARARTSELDSADLRRRDHVQRSHERRHLHRRHAIVSGQVNGRVTVGSGENIIVKTTSPRHGGDDVLGLVAYSDLWVAHTRRRADVDMPPSSSRQTRGTPRARPTDRQQDDLHRLRRNGDRRQLHPVREPHLPPHPNLQFLSPPWFPAVDDTYTATFFREVEP